jgi:hypothetical protein
MPQFIDRLLAADRWRVISAGIPRDCFDDAKTAERAQMLLHKDLASSVVFSIDNIAEYYFANHLRPGGCDGPEAFPNLAQPYPRAFFEYRLQPHMYDALFDEADRGWERQITHVGALVVTCSPSLVSGPDWEDRYGRDGVQRSQCQWLQFVSLFSSNALNRDACRLSFKSILTLAADGTLLTPPHVSLWHLTKDMPSVIPEEAWIEIARLGQLVNPLFLATSLLHCKNTSTADHCPPPKLNKAYRRRHGRPLVSYKTLTVTPMKGRKKGADVAAGAADPKALHLCRGHFKDYRKSGGLFGKHKGLFWWDMHARGALDQGAVVKDYAIKLPESGGSLEHR